MNNPKNLVLAVTFAALGCFSPLMWATEGPQSQAETSTRVEAEIQQLASEQRDKIVDEAVLAVAETRKALRALDQKDTAPAMDSLALALGKLELVIAREPKLALAPTSVSVTTHDLHASLDALREAIEQAQSLLEDGNIQEARNLMANLGSEVVITRVNLPLGSYAEAIKLITPLIDSGEIDQAKDSLRAVLNTLVVTREVVPLPLLRAEISLAIADSLASKRERSDEEQASLDNAVLAINNEVQLAELLGYAEKSDIKKIREELSKIEEILANGNPGQGLFSTIEKTLAGIF